MEISLCMIVKNEEKHLQKCLTSIAEYVKDIVIVDTGSTDTTKEIAKRYTNKVYDFTWCDDFAKARNFSLSKASNDWVLILDADEIITQFNNQSIEEFINTSHKVVGRIKRVNPFEDAEEIKVYIERVNRIFNKKYFEYEGTIHEQVTSKDHKEYKTQFVEIEADHIGYLNEVISATNKLERNINLLITAIEKNPQDPYLYYQIGKSYYKKKDYEKAYEAFVKAINKSADFKYEYTQDLIESYGYVLLKCERYSQAMELKKYKNYYEKSPDYNFVMGLIYMNNGEFEGAVNFLKKCIGNKEGKIEGVNSYLPNYNIGIIYETLGFVEKAFKSYRQCGDYLLAQKRIEKMMSQQHKNKNVAELQIDSEYNTRMKSDIQKYIEDGNLEEAKCLLEQAFKSINKDIELFSMQSIIEIMENRLEDAEKTLKSALEISCENFDIVYNMAYLYEVKHQNQEAIDFYSQALNLTQVEGMKNDISAQIKNIRINNFKTSIIILTYNNLDYNKICIESIKKHTKKDTYEIIVVDNNSTDGTIEWLKDQEDLIVVYNKENLGFPKGCNQGINIAIGDEILLLNNDTIVTPKWLGNLRECLYSKEDIGAVGPVTNSCPNYQTIPVNYTNVEEMLQFAENHNNCDPGKWEEKLRLIGFCMLIKRKVLSEIGLLDEIFTPGNFEDDDFSLRMRKEKYRLMLCKDTFIHHFGGTSFSQDKKKYTELLKVNCDKFQKKWGIDPYQIIDIEKEAADIVIGQAEQNINVLHVGCAGGATLLRIKNQVPTANLYGIEANKEVVVNVKHFAEVASNILELMKDRKSTYFDYILVSDCYHTDFISIHALKALSKYLNEGGTMIMTTSKKEQAIIDKHENDIKQVFSSFHTRPKEHDEGTIIMASHTIKFEDNVRIPQIKNNYISIIITVTDHATHLEECVESINSFLRKENREIIIANYGPSQQVHKLKKQVNNLNIIQCDILDGYANGINRAIGMTKGSEILFIHSDVIITPSSIEKLRKALYSNDDIGGVNPVSNNSQYNQDIQVKYNSYNDLISFSERYNCAPLNKQEERIKLDSFCFLIKKEVVSKCGQLCEKYITDVYTMNDYFFKMRTSGYRLMLCKDVFIHHYGEDHVLNIQDDTNTGFLNDEKIFEEEWGFNVGYSSMIREEIIDLIDQYETEPIKVMEVGCACGATLLQIKNKYKNASLYGIELNEKAAKIAKLCANVTAENIENKGLSYQNDYFDYIIFADVLEHLKQPWLVLSNIRKYLKPDGKILASIPNIMHFSVIRDLLNQRWEYKEWGILDKTHYRFFTLKEIEEMFSNTGYNINKINNKFFIESERDSSFIEALGDLTGLDLSIQHKTLQYIIKACKDNNY